MLMSKAVSTMSLKIFALLAFLIPLLIGCQAEPYQTTFDAKGTWGTGNEPDVTGNVQGGVYDMVVEAESGIFWATANQSLGYGTYRLEATQVDGPLDNGYGLMFLMDTQRNDFYLFEVSGDGFVWIGRCMERCNEDIVPLVEDGWFPSDAVKVGINQTNVLRVEARDGAMKFYVNDTLVGEAVDTVLTEGDIGVAVETYGAGGVQIHFDNFTFEPADS